MNVFQLRAYLRYRRRAKGRHGTHSPFIYRLVEECLLARVPEFQRHSAEDELKQKLLRYFKPEHILFPGRDSRTWSAIIETKELNGQQVIAVSGIHASPAAEQAWLELQQLPGIRASADVFWLGLLFFDESFQQRQHFVLKYR